MWLEYQKDWMLVDIDWVLINGWLCFTWRWFYLPGNSQQLLQQRQQPAGGCCSRRCRGRPLHHACIHPFSSSYFAPIYSSLLWTRRPPTNYLGPQCTTCSAQLDRNPLYQLLIQGISHIWYKGIKGKRKPYWFAWFCLSDSTIGHNDTCVYCWSLLSTLRWCILIWLGWFW